MASVEVLNKSNLNVIMAEKDVTAQKLFNLNIPANTLGINGRLRIFMTLGSVLSTIVECESVECITCCGAELVEEPDSGRFEV